MKNHSANFIRTVVVELYHLAIMTTLVRMIMHAVQYNNHCALKCKVTVNYYILQRFSFFFFFFQIDQKAPAQRSSESLLDTLKVVITVIVCLPPVINC